VITECAAICAYLADVFPEAGLGPQGDEKPDYYRWMFYAAGPVEQAFTNRAMKWEVPPERERMFGYGNYERVIAVLDELFSLRDYVCGERFTAADVYVGSQIMFPMQFGMLDARDSFVRYRDRLQARPAYKRANEIDEAKAAEMGLSPPPQPAQPQPA
jgi:glutathione S-transferase